MPKVKIFTSNSIDKLHPRIAMQQEILLDNGYEVEIYKTSKKRDSLFWELLNLFCLKYFKWGAITNFKNEISKGEIIQIYDLQLLPLAKWAKKKNCKVIYETLDDNLHLNFFAVSQKIRFLKYFKRIIIAYVGRVERKLTDNYCDRIIVNSPNLTSYYPTDKTTLIYYASGLQGLKADKYDTMKETVFLYLGKLTKSKGAAIYNELIEKFKLRLLFYGKAEDAYSKELIEKLNHKVIYRGNLALEDFKTSLNKDIKEFNLIGLSIIIPENESYMFQEANKDIDYLAMNIPFIGNERPPTKKKIDAGAGVFYFDDLSIQNLNLNTDLMYDSIQLNQLNLYNTFSKENFSQSYLKVFKFL
jgi:hypothetical protein